MASPAQTPERVRELPPGLRERSRARRRTRILLVAQRLFAEQGYAETTVAQIAEAAEVAPRTVSGYFPAKADLALVFAEESSARLRAAVSADPTQDLLSVLDRWLTAEAEGLDPDQMLLLRAVRQRNPELEPLMRTRIAETSHVMRAAIGRRTGLLDSDPMLTICHAAVAAALAGYLDTVTDRGFSAERHRAVVAYVGILLSVPTGD